MAGNGSNILRVALKERGWSHSKIVAELRRQAAATGEGLPKTESLLTLVSRWVNNHQQPDGFYRDLLARALDRPAAELFGEEDQAAELEAGAEPWRLARALELSSVGAAALDGIEAAVADFARRYPSTSPASLLDPVAGHYRDVSRLLEGPLPVAYRRRLVVVAGVVAGLAGNLAFDLKQRPRAEGYFAVALQAAYEAESADLGAWTLAMRSILPAYEGDPAGALALIQQGQAFARQPVTGTRRAWLAAMEAKAHAGLADPKACDDA